MYVSVVIPTYNRYEFLKRALESVYAQTYLSSEIIVVDDGSTDKTSQIKKDFPKIKYIYQKNSGVSSARNLGIKNAKHEWIAFLDSDDTWHKNKLELQMTFHKQNPTILMSYTNERWIRDSKEIKIPKKFKKYGGNIFEKCLSHCIIAPSATIVHKDLLGSSGVFDEHLEVCEDYDLWLRIALENEIGLIDEALITKYAGHEDQLSFKYWGMDRFRVRSLEKLLNYSFPSEAPQEYFLRGAWERDGDVIIDTLVKKYKLLLKGAIKYDRISDIKEYEGKLKIYE